MVRVEVISASIELIWGGRAPGGSGAAGAGAKVDVEGALTRGATGVFSLLVSCDEGKLDCSIGDDGSGDRKFSVGSDSG